MKPEASSDQSDASDTLMRNLILRNGQAQPLQAQGLRKLARTLLQDILKNGNYELGIYIVGASEITRLNEQFLRHKGVTDVITFNYRAPSLPNKATNRPGTIFGDIFVCLDEAVRQASRFRTTRNRELARYIIHGVLHLLGYDDRTAAARRKMKRKENELLRKLADSQRLSASWHRSDKLSERTRATKRQSQN